MNITWKNAPRSWKIVQVCRFIVLAAEIIVCSLGILNILEDVWAILVLLISISSYLVAYLDWNNMRKWAKVNLIFAIVLSIVWLAVFAWYLI